jgi:hypothetical protein
MGLDLIQAFQRWDASIVSWWLVTVGILGNYHNSPPKFKEFAEVRGLCNSGPAANKSIQ